jgi:hypothetical protein
MKSAVDPELHNQYPPSPLALYLGKENFEQTERKKVVEFQFVGTK